MLYGRNTFCFDDIEAIGYFSRTILPCRLSALKIMEVYLTANNQCSLLSHGASPIKDAMSGMTGLRTVRLVSLLPGGQSTFVEHLLEQLRQVLESSTDANVVVIGYVAESMSITS